MSEGRCFVNGRVLTMDGADAEVLVVRDGRIAAVGTRGLEDAHADVPVEDLAGRTLAPGFIDAHQHLGLAALHARWADLADVHDLDEAAARLHAAAADEPDAPWVRAAAWVGPEGGLELTRADLDGFGIDRPILVGCFSYHRGVVSSAGLDALGISSSTPDPPGGRYERDARGEPDGRLLETAWTGAHQQSLRGYDDPVRWGELLEARAGGLLAEGITAVHEAACPPELEAVYRTMAAAGTLPVSILVMPHGPILSGLDRARLDGPPTGEGDEDLRVGPVKLFADGGIDIAIDAHVGGRHLEHGELFPALGEQMRAAAERGFGVAVHAMGNVGLQATIDAWAAVASTVRTTTPLRIEHVTLAGPEHIAALRDLGAIGVVQPGFVELIGRNIGDLRFDEATWLPFRDLLDAGVALAASSDGPCHITDPLISSRHGATRLTMAGATVGVDQAVPRRTWLELYTAGAADAGGQSAERGRLRPGLRADLVVLDGDVDGPPDGQVTVAETWRGGERVYRRATDA